MKQPNLAAMLAPRLRRRGSTATRTAAAAALALGFVVLAHGSATTSAAERASAERTQVASSIELAQAFTNVLNTHDVDALVGMFSEADSGATINADRFAWQKYEIRAWAEQQAAANVHAEAYDYRTTDQGATWRADMYRDDWNPAGIDLIRVTNTIWVHNGQLADFTSTLSESRDSERLGQLWRPGAVPTRNIGTT